MICQLCGRRIARIYDEDLELRLCPVCRASYQHGDFYMAIEQAIEHEKGRGNVYENES
jgi:uncharacterized protein with PIN domain